ncbi:MAG: SRPBCC family protein [Myxococcales bacterium]|nr:SRPBCC family protein [Myxococcales bacterium]MDD9970587.1 SRPBCC family protein [Myxococcales bacterium]
MREAGNRQEGSGTLSWVLAVSTIVVGAMWRPHHATADQQPGTGPDEIRVTSLEHPGTSVRWGRAEGVVQAPLSRVMSVVSDYGAYHEFLPHFRASRVLSQRGSKALVYMEAGVARDTLTIWAQLKIAPRQTDGRTRVIEAHMMKGNLDHMEATWEITPIDAHRTRVAFQILVDPKVPLPASLVSRENEKASKQTIGALRKRLKAG